MSTSEQVRTVSLGSIRDGICIAIEQASTEAQTSSTLRDTRAALARREGLLMALAMTFAQLGKSGVDCGLNAHNLSDRSAAERYYLEWLPRRYQW